MSFDYRVAVVGFIAYMIGVGIERTVSKWWQERKERNGE
jgi:hypothetical protein